METRILFYSKEKERFAELFRSASRRINLLVLVRLLVFVSGIAISIFLFRFGSLAGSASLLAAVLLFLYVFRLFTRFSREKDYYFNLITINENEIRCLGGDYSCFNSGNEFIDKDHDFSHDIDLFGSKSLFQYLDRTFSDTGRSRLADWLKNPYSLADKILLRSESIRELSANAEWRQKFIATGTLNKVTAADRKRLEEWLHEDPVFMNWRSVMIAVIVLSSLNILLLILAITGVTVYSFFTLSFLFNLFVLSLRFKKINRIHSLLSRQYGSLNTLKELVEQFNNAGFNSPYLEDIHKRLSSEDYPALDTIGRLAAIIRDFDFRLNMITGVILNGMLMWDFCSVLRLEKWKREVRDIIPVWFEDLAEIEALVSLSNFAFNNPGYAYPVISESDEFISSEKLGHPLIMEEYRVVNNFRVEHNGIINIITGANMSGKSTFLRTVAVNLVLAMTGAPVCASTFRFRPVKIFSSMRTSDSLSENESYFYAELKRLKKLKDRIEDDEPLFFILDEILKGTNSQDKSEGSRMFIEKIIRKNATGIIATHDVTLGTLESDHPHSIRNRCFEILINDDSISFDYILRDGITTRMNAAILMRQQGIID